ncbi:MAG TPA: DegT/DnrJ/EryC1/StrS aminotransferase family protein [Thermoguttaceae bacterium]|nr:DegT/DnrJ/EryC1/StrS aminotransferase family protein [Thermoguttaceae bacterium]
MHKIVMDDKRTTDPRLALEGGTPLRSTPMPPWPVFDQTDAEVAGTVLRSGKVSYWTGSQGRLFEEEFAQLIGCRHAVAMSNGSVALEAALAALDIRPGDEVIVTARSFVASAACCVLRGAVPIFADVDPTSGNITPQSIRSVLTPRTRAIIAVHLAGWPCDMDPIMQLAAEQGLQVIEDCAQAHGATYKGRTVGSIGHVAAFSFCQDKILSTGGEGGMLTTNDPRIWEAAWSYKDHGKDYDATHRRDRTDVFRWVHESIGTNARMTEMQSAIGRSMLRRLPDWLATRRKHAAVLNGHLGRMPELRISIPPRSVEHSYYKYYAFVRPERLRDGWSRDRIVRALQAEGIPCGSGICPEIYREKAFQSLGLGPARRLATAKQLGEASLMLPVHPTLTRTDILDMCRALRKVLAVAAVHVPGTMQRAA